VSRILIVNADDLGLSGGVNRGIARAHDEGIVTSASAMVRRTQSRQFSQVSPTIPAIKSILICGNPIARAAAICSS